MMFVIVCSTATEVAITKPPLIHRETQDFHKVKVTHTGTQ